MKNIFSIILVFSSLIACQPGEHKSKNTSTESTTLSKEDSLYKEVVAIHDEVMPKMGKLIGFKKTLQVKIDSVDNALKSRKAVSTVQVKEKLTSTKLMLENAEKGMNDWMEQFDWEKKLAGKEDLIKYYEDQKQKAGKMKADLLAALDSAAKF